MFSLKKRLRKSLFLQMLLLMLVVLLTLYIFMQKLVNEQLLTRLQHDADSLITLLEKKQGRWQVDPTHISTVYSRVRSGHYYRIKTPQQILRSRSLFDYPLTPQDLNVETAERSYQMVGLGGQNWLVWQQAIDKKGDRIEIWIAEDISPVDVLLLRFALIAVLLIVGLTLVFMLVQQKILDHSFRVFDRLREQLQSIRQGESSHAGMPVPQEILPLAQEIELLVQQMKQRITRTRNAIGNLAHEIKRPLQILSLFLDQGGDPQVPRQSLQEIRQIVERELRRAKISASPAVGGAFDATQEIPMLAKVLEKIYPDIEISLQLPQDLPAFNLDRDDMFELIGNLLDNACKFAHSRVRISVSGQQGRFLLTVEDDGDGVDSAQLERITEKGFRLDESRSGHGLGLGICADIVQGYGGRLSFSVSRWQGLKAEVEIGVRPL